MDCVLSDSEFLDLRGLVYEATGINLSDAKRQMLRSRLGKRLNALKINTFGAYYEFVKSQMPRGPEVTEFINAVTTNKTDFFREPHHFEFVTQTVLPEIERRASFGKRSLDVWHAGCSTGEEPYTLAIALREAFRNPGQWDVRQLATDIDSRVLDHAQRGVYEMTKLSPVTYDLRKRYFLKGKGTQEESVLVKPVLQEWLTWKKLNLLADSWPISRTTAFDIIFCRNVMIYFDKPTQQKLVQRFMDQLAPGGYLIIGHSESLFGISDDFVSLGQTIYRSNNAKRGAA